MFCPQKYGSQKNNLPLALPQKKRERENYDLVVFFLQNAVAHYPLINYHITLDCILNI